jgi:hypothetical protein
VHSPAHLKDLACLTSRVLDTGVLQDEAAGAPAAGVLEEEGENFSLSSYILCFLLVYMRTCEVVVSLRDLFLTCMENFKNAQALGTRACGARKI